jgi:outer membrane protein TolC
MKRLVSGLIVSTMMLGVSSIALADGNSSDITVKLDGEVLTFDQPPVIIHDRTMVPLRGVLEKLGANVTWNPQDRTVTVTKDNEKIVLAIDSVFASINGSRVVLDEPAHIVNDRTVVPLRFISEALGADVQWDGANRTVLISTKGFSGMTGGTSASVDSASSNAAAEQSLTYQKAVELALANNYQLKESQSKIDQMKAQLDKASDDVKYVPSTGVNSSAAKTYTNYAQASINYEGAKKAYEANRDSLVYAVKTAYNGVLQALENKRLADLALQNASLQLQVAIASNQNGTIGKLDLQQKQNDYNSALSAQQLAAKAVDSAYVNLDQLIGIPQDARPALLDNPQFQPMENVDLDTKVTQAESESPILWQYYQDINMADLGLRLFTFNDPSNPNSYRAQEISVDMKKYTAADQRDQLDKKVRTIYYQIKQLEDQYTQDQAKLESAQNALKITQAKYDNGMATKADLVAAQLSVESAKQKLFSDVIQHDNLMLQFSTPWVS